ncbi:MAG: peptidoglycan DD-metalloendopeptidase family protein [Desulfuromonadales bacterium]|nr:peptidoglycan DD-metalloendopeptidase family protein [Desulfuromonadales bacterium]MBN2793212.1 peptidoglycan DD-metalloendopeptidase family protein [Desulfuromonadales bacterium]
MSLNKDFHPPLNSPGRRQPSKVKKIIFGALVMMGAGILFFLVGSEPSAELEARETPLAVTAPVSSPPLTKAVREEFKALVPTGSSITALIGDYFSLQEIDSLNRQSKEVYPFTKICAGQPYRIVTIDNQFDSFIYEIDDEEQLIIRLDKDQPTLELQPIEYEVVVESVQGEIKTSLFEAIQEIGEKPELAYILADIFGWDINFILDLRVGDRFQALVQKRYRDGEPAGYGRVLAAEFINQGESFKALRFKDGDQKVSFYNEKGENLRKAFLKAPLSFTRISSGYTMRRLHPITKVWKAHPAIDYAAPIGTPVKTVGDGSITRKGYGEGNGHFLEVTHSNGYKTMYLHLKGFARGIAQGKRVHQGQIIGYVGSSGMSTGPHLDFRMTRHGKPVNPLKLKAPAAEAVSAEHMAEFKALTAPLLARLEESYLQHTQLAQTESNQKKAL